MSNPSLTSTIDAEALRDRLSAKANIQQRSSYIGVRWNKSRKRWRVTIRKRKAHCSWELKSQREAARVYDAAARLVHGEDAKQNFRPSEDPSVLSLTDIREKLEARGLLD